MTITLPNRTGGKALVTFEGTYRTSGGTDQSVVCLNDNGVIVSEIETELINYATGFKISCISPLNGQVVKAQFAVLSGGGTLSIYGSGGLLGGIIKIDSWEIGG